MNNYLEDVEKSFGIDSNDTEGIINKRIAGYRKLAGYTQSEAAELLGMKRNTYARMEKYGNPSPDMLKKIAELFNVKITLLLYGVDPDDYTVKSERMVFAQPKYNDVLPLSLMETNIIRALRSLPIDDVKKIIDTVNELYSKNNYTF